MKNWTGPAIDMAEFAEQYPPKPQQDPNLAWGWFWFAVVGGLASYLLSLI